MNRLLSQAEADALIALEKHSIPADSVLGFPEPGRRVVFPLQSPDAREKFIIDVVRGRIRLRKCTYQTRGRVIVVLVRVDLDGSDHQNPDGEVVPCPHIHTYREDYDDKWARPLPAAAFSSPDDLWATLHHFFAFCNVTRPPAFQRTTSP